MWRATRQGGCGAPKRSEARSSPARMEAAMQGGWAESPFRRSMAADWRDTPKVLLKELHHFACGYSCEDCVCGKGSPCGVAADVSTNTLVLPIVFILDHSAFLQSDCLWPV